MYLSVFNTPCNSKSSTTSKKFLTLPRFIHFPFSLSNASERNGVVSEISYVGALGGERHPILVDAGGAENGSGAKRRGKRNWWATAKELARVTKAF
ncbi:hypothetical protein H2248_003014 [Termitomyces sp. 'cryptogamus']|nr:hypothetical protein H2248_003014 [Termitomyces sp. 'cryptogamus']